MNTGCVKRHRMNILNSIFVAVVIFGTTTIDFAIGLRTPTLEFRHQNYQSSRNNNNNNNINKRSLYQNNNYDGLGSRRSSSFPKLRPLCTLSMARSTKEETSSSNSEKKSDGDFFLDFVGGGKRQETTDMDVARYLVSSEEVEVEKIISADDIGNQLPLSTIFVTLALGAALFLRYVYISR